MIGKLKKYVLELNEALSIFMGEQAAEPVELLRSKLAEARERGYTIFVFGNGGSAATASHFAADLSKNTAEVGKRPFIIRCLNDGMAAVTAYANDNGYHKIFVDQLHDLIDENDIVIAISGSGESENVLEAVSYANALGVFTCGLTGFGGGELGRIADCHIHINSWSYEIIEDCHVAILHSLVRGFKDG